MSGTVSSALFSTANFLRKVGKNLNSKDRSWNEMLKKWRKEDKENNYRYEYPHLDENSVVFDLGGYKGDWASGIFSRYLATVYIFEPHPIFYKDIVHRFQKNEKIKPYEVGLGSHTHSIKLSSDADATSVYKTNGTNQKDAKIQDYVDFVQEHKIQNIDLMKINIEGGEYDLLDHIIEKGLIKDIDNLQIQFHNFVPNAEERMKNIQVELKKTHKLTYTFPFFWENWVRV